MAQKELGLVYIDVEGIESEGAREAIERALQFFSEPEPEINKQIREASGFKHVYVGPIERMMLPWTDRAVHFGDAIYEACGVHNGELYLYDRHMQRLRNGFKNMQFIEEPSNILPTIEQWGKLIAKASGFTTNALLYFQVSRCIAPARGHPFPRGQKPAVYIQIKQKGLPSEEHYTKGCSIVLMKDQRHDYCDMKTVNLLGNVFGEEAAAKKREQGDQLCFESVLYRLPYSIDTPLHGGDFMEGIVTEACAASVGAVFDGVLWTHPESSKVLPSITRRYLLERATAAGIPVKEERFTVKRMLTEASEVILFGTTTSAMPVVNIYLADKNDEVAVINTGKPGPIQQQIRKFWRE